MSDDSILRPEIATQKKTIDFLCDQLGYTYIGNLKDQSNKNIREDDLHQYLVDKKGYSDIVANRAIRELVMAASNLQSGLYEANKKVYSLLKYGAKVRDINSAQPITVFFIDFAMPANNNFAVAEEVTVIENLEKRPDLVIYINGIAVAVIELKRSAVSLEDGIRQNITNQQPLFIQSFFTTIQMCLAGNESEGVKYGTLLTKEIDYLSWKDDGFKLYPEERAEVDVRIEDKTKTIDNKFLASIYALFHKERFLDIIDNFIIFNKGNKQICRYNQYYAIKRAQKRLAAHKGGIVWHTQGSGKSLTMVWLSKWIKTNMPDSRVLIITDREELDGQIEKLFKGVGELNIVRTQSGKDLVTRLNQREDVLMCSLIHKFGKHEGEPTEDDYEKYIEEVKKSLPHNFEAKGNIFVFVDECHRTQSGKLHAAMAAILPKAIFVGFSGTPLLKKDKENSVVVFGPFIHTYKFNEAVEDGVVLDLKYEARDIPQSTVSQEKIDAWFESKTRGLMPKAKAMLKEKWADMQKMYSSRSRLEKIADDIIFDFEIQERLKNGRGNAILVADSIYSACKFYEIFVTRGFTKCAIITSFAPSTGDLRTEATGTDAGEEESFYKYKVYLRMLGLDPEHPPVGEAIDQKAQEFELEARRKFTDEPANMKLLIVVDKLLTGFDAHPCTCLYIDKNMQDHGLFQAVCRVNRLDGEDKEFGYIVDYKQLFQKLEEALDIYASDYAENAFAGFDPVDIDGLLKDKKETSKRVFLDRLDHIETLCENVSEPKQQIDYEHYFCGENGVNPDRDEMYAQRRTKLYFATNKLIRAYAEFKPYLDDFGYSEIEKNDFEKKVSFYTELKLIIGRASGDLIDLKAYEPDMRYLIDNFVVAQESQKLGAFDEYTLLDFVKAQSVIFAGEGGDARTKESAAESIENNIAKEIVERKVVNPKYYEKMSTLLNDLVEQRKRGVLAYKDLLSRYLEVIKKIEKPEESGQYPEAIKGSPALRALYDNFGNDEALALKIHEAVLQSAMEGFKTNEVKARQVKRRLFEILGSTEKVEQVYKLIVEQAEY